MIAPAMFYYHAGKKAIVFNSPNGPVMTSTEAIRAAGWKADDDELARCLPRADPSPLLIPGRR